MRGFGGLLTELSHVSKLPTTGLPDPKEPRCLKGCRSQYSEQDDARVHDAVLLSRITMLCLIIQPLLYAFRGRIAFVTVSADGAAKLRQRYGLEWHRLRDRIST